MDTSPEEHPAQVDAFFNKQATAEKAEHMQNPTPMPRQQAKITVPYQVPATQMPNHESEQNRQSELISNQTISKYLVKDLLQNSQFKSMFSQKTEPRIENKTPTQYDRGNNARSSGRNPRDPAARMCYLCKEKGHGYLTCTKFEAVPRTQEVKSSGATPFRNVRCRFHEPHVIGDHYQTECPLFQYKPRITKGETM